MPSAADNLPRQGGGRSRPSPAPGGGRFASRFTRSPDVTANARRLRRDSTEEETQLWHLLRGRQLGGFSFRRQHPIGAYVADFYCPSARLVVELDGEPHATPRGRKHDAARTAWLNAAGIDVLRFWSSDVLRMPNAVAQAIAIKLSTLTKNNPHPASPLQGEVQNNR